MWNKEVVITAIILSLFLGGEIGVTSTPAASLVTQSGLRAANPLNQPQVDYLYQLAKKLHPQDGTSYFGDNTVVDGDPLAIQGDTLVVGNSYHDGYTGTVYIFERNRGGGENWGLVKQLFDLEGVEEDRFGSAVALDGDTLVVGADYADVNNGAILIFERDRGGTNNWGLVTRIGGSSDDSRFGISVSLNGDTLVVGASSVDYATGGAYILERDQGGSDNWGQVKMLTATDTTEYNAFGRAVAVEGDTVLVGAPWDEYGNPSDQGSVYVFERDEGGAGNWGQVGKLIGDGDNGAKVGSSLALEGDLLAVGAPGYSPGLGSAIGAVFIFRYNLSDPNHWESVTMLIDPINDKVIAENFGNSVDIAGQLLVVGHSQRQVGENEDQGAAFVFERDESGADNWGQTAMLVDAEGNAGDTFGGEVAISGTTVFVGAPRDDDFGEDSGMVHIFEQAPYYFRFVPLIVK